MSKVYIINNTNLFRGDLVQFAFFLATSLNMKVLFTNFWCVLQKSIKQAVNCLAIDKLMQNLMLFCLKKLFKTYTLRIFLLTYQNSCLNYLITDIQFSPLNLNSQGPTKIMGCSNYKLPPISVIKFYLQRDQGI